MPGVIWMQCTDADPSRRNQLKHIQKIRYVADEADQYERAWLLLADIYIQSGKFDLAQVWLLTSDVYIGVECSLLALHACSKLQPLVTAMDTFCLIIQCQTGSCAGSARCIWLGIGCSHKELMHTHTQTMHHEC